jgi:hypothetical protein
VRFAQNGGILSKFNNLAKSKKIKAKITTRKHHALMFFPVIFRSKQPHHRQAATKEPRGTGGMAHLVAAVHGRTTGAKRDMAEKAHERERGELTHGEDNLIFAEERESLTKGKGKTSCLWLAAQGKIDPQTLLNPLLPINPQRNPPKYSLTHELPNSQAQTFHMGQPLKSNLNNVRSFSPLARSPWIFDCAATDPMTFNPSDLLSTVPTFRTHIQTANGEYVSVDWAGSVNISPSLNLKNCLLVPSLS